MHDDFYQMYLEEMRAITPCTGEEQKELLISAKNGDETAKKRLIEGNLGAALEYAREFEGQGALLTDLVQEANMALMEALEEYLRGVTESGFDGFAGKRIREALIRTVEEEKASDQTGEELAARVNVLQEVAKAMAAELGREATLEELAAKMKMTEDEVRGIMKMALDAISMNAADMDLEELAGMEGLEIMEGTEENEGFLGEEFEPGSMDEV